jgi:hypothetical protein
MLLATNNHINHPKAIFYQIQTRKMTDPNLATASNEVWIEHVNSNLELSIEHNPEDFDDNVIQENPSDVSNSEDGSVQIQDTGSDIIGDTANKKVGEDVEKGIKSLLRADSDETESTDSEHSHSNSDAGIFSFLRFHRHFMMSLSGLIPFVIFVIFCAIIGYVFSGNTDQHNLVLSQESSNSSTSFLSSDNIVSTIAPTAPTAPTATPTKEPTDAPSQAPSWGPRVSQDFQLRLHWESSYFWQETFEETWWCMECASCDGYTIGDGWEADCETPGPGPGSCREGQSVWIRECKDKRRFYSFVIISNYNSGDQIKVHDTNLCLSTVRNKYLELRNCDNKLSNQLFAPIYDIGKFELRPYDQRLLSLKQAKCLSQLHHPKDKEVVGLHQCETNYNHETNFWEEYHRPGRPFVAPVSPTAGNGFFFN